MSDIVFTLSRLEKNIRGKSLFKNISLNFLRGAKIGLIGSNGSGKSTLLRIMAGLDHDFSGEAYAAPGVSIGYLPQEPEFDPEKTVLETIQEGAQETYNLLKRFDELNMKLCEAEPDEMDKLSTQISDLQDRLDAMNAWDIDQDIKRLMLNLRTPAGHLSMRVLSGGEKRRVALARLILSNPDMYLLDEPTNHLDALSVHWLQNFLKNVKATVMVITHDRYFLDEITKWILELDKGKGIPWEASYHDWLEKKIAQMQSTQSGDSLDQSKVQVLEDELAWFKLSEQDKFYRNQQRLSQPTLPERRRFDITLPPIPRLGQKVCEIEGLTKSFGDKVLFSGFSMRLPPAAVVGVVGPNGAGKSTFFKILSGLEQPDSGQISWGESVVLGFADQLREDLDENRTVFENLAGGQDVVEIRGQMIKVRSFLAHFGFRGPDQQKPIRVLSGGERNRLYLAKTLLSGANVLILDEPTNDLDIETLRSLEHAILSFPGTILIASHDRCFLDRITTQSIVFEGQGVVNWFDGPISAYLARNKTL